MTATTAPTTDFSVATPRASRSFPLFGAVAGIAGFLGSAILWQWIEADVKAQGPQAVVDVLAASRVKMHVGASLSWIATFALIAFAIGYLRFLSQRVGEDHALVQTARLGLTAGVGTMFLTSALKSLTVGGLPGAVDAAMYDLQDVATLHVLTDQAQWVGWMGVVVAMAVTALLVFRERILSRWYGIFTAAFTLLVAGMTLVLGLPYSAGLAGPLWLIVSTVVLYRATRRAA